MGVVREKREPSGSKNSFSGDRKSHELKSLNDANKRGCEQGLYLVVAVRL